MAIRDYFKKAPEAELDRQKTMRDPEQILAWLEELSRLGTVVDLEFPGSDLIPVPGKVGKVDEADGTCAFQCRWKPAKEPARGQRIHLVFGMDHQRFQADLVYQGRGNYLEYRCSLPNGFLHAERRDSVRVKMRPRDDFNIIVLQSLFEGLGLSGKLLDISFGGCCFIINRVIQIKDERRMAISDGLLPVGTPLALVRMPNLPQLPMVECGGFLCSIRQASEGVIMGLRFEGMGSFETAILGKFLNERVPGLTVGFPHKRRIRELTESERLVPQPVAAPAVPEEPAAEAEAPAPAQPEGEEATGVEDGRAEGPDSGLRDAITDKDRLNKLRKRGKKILLLMGDELDRIMVMAMLHQDGYRCLFEARSLVQALDHQRRIPLDLLMVDQKVGHLRALEVVSLLREKGMPATVSVVVMMREVDHALTLAMRAGKVHLLVDRPLDFEGALKPAMERILGL